MANKKADGVCGRWDFGLIGGRATGSVLSAATPVLIRCCRFQTQVAEEQVRGS
jgi:hypothetical protein